MDANLRDRWLARADRRLSGAGLRAGSARTGVVEFLAREGQCLLSAQQIIDGAILYLKFWAPWVLDSLKCIG